MSQTCQKRHRPAAAAFQYGLLVSRNMLPQDRATHLLKFHFDHRKVDESYWSTVYPSSLCGRNRRLGRDKFNRSATARRIRVLKIVVIGERAGRGQVGPCLTDTAHRPLPERRLYASRYAAAQTLRQRSLRQILQVESSYLLCS